MVRFFFVFLAIQLSLFGLNMLNWVQKHLVEPWTALLAKICAFLVTWFDKSAVAEGKVGGRGLKSQIPFSPCGSVP